MLDSSSIEFSNSLSVNTDLITMFIFPYFVLSIPFRIIFVCNSDTHLLNFFFFRNTPYFGPTYLYTDRPISGSFLLSANLFVSSNQVNNQVQLKFQE